MGGSGASRTRTAHRPPRTAAGSTPPRTGTGESSGATATVSAVTSGDRVITTDFLFDTGQRPNFYDVSRIHRKATAPEPTGRLLVVYDYLEHGAGEVFTVDSYSDVAKQMEYQDIPSFVEGKTEFDVTAESGSTPLRNGRLGMIDRFTVYVSHNLKKSGSEFSVIGGHTMGFTFASQMTNMETIRSETTFGNIIRGLQVYGYKVVKPEALATMIVTL